MPNPTLRDIVKSFTEQELDLSVPIDFKDVDADSYPYVNQYNTYLANGDYASAYEYRTINAEILEPLIYDAKKANIQQAMAINAYLFSKAEKSASNTSYDNSKSGSTAENVQDAIDACFQFVSDGKKLIAAAITDKKIITAATDSFKTMADNIKKIVLGSGNARTSDVLSGKTFTNNDGIEYTGTMTDCSGQVKLAAGSLDGKNNQMQLKIPNDGYYDNTSKLYITYSTLRSLIGLTANKIVKGNTILGIAGTAVAAPTSLNGQYFAGRIGWGTVETFQITFKTPFATIPTILVNANGVDYVKTIEITKAGFKGEFEVAGTPDMGWTDVYVTWSAVE